MMMMEGFVRKLKFNRKATTVLVLIGAGLITALFGGMNASQANAQAAPVNQAQKIDDTWQGTLHIPQQKDLRTVVKITKAATGALQVVLYSIDQSGQGIPANKASFEDGMLKYSIDMIDGKYEGKMSSDGKSIDGTWTQGTNPLTLLLERATSATEWTIPQPPPKLPPFS